MMSNIRLLSIILTPCFLMASCESESPIETDPPENPKLVKPKPEEPGS